MDSVDSGDEIFSDSDSDINDDSELEEYRAELRAYKLKARRKQGRMRYKIKKRMGKLIAEKEARKDARKNARKGATGTCVAVGGRYRRNTHSGELFGHESLLEDEEFEQPYDDAYTPPVFDKLDSLRTQEEQLTSFDRVETRADVGIPTVTILDRPKLHRDPSKYRQGQKAIRNRGMAFTEQTMRHHPVLLRDLSDSHRHQKSKKKSAALAMSWAGTKPLRVADLDISSDSEVDLNII